MGILKKHVINFKTETEPQMIRFLGISKECICHPVENVSFTFFLGHFIIHWFTQILDSYVTGCVPVYDKCNKFLWKSQYFGQDLFGETQKSQFFGKVLFCVIFPDFFWILTNLQLNTSIDRLTHHHSRN